MTPAERQKIVVGMSGGVDSSVAAALLKDQGYDVIGIMLRLWSDDNCENRCCAPEAQSEARRIAAQLEIPFYVIDAQQEFYDLVVEPFVAGYGSGITPNPCLSCNRQVRWQFLLSRAKAFGAELVATGHYARLSTGPDGLIQLLRNLDSEKDQSYFLHILTQDQLRQTRFPLADYTKEQVRKLARNYGLAVADRPDSQDLCFVGDRDYREFLINRNPSLFMPGKILSPSGKQLGEHSGLANYTIGQRKGLGIAGPEPYYVIDKYQEENILVIGYKDDLGKSSFSVDEINWISGIAPKDEVKAEVKIRYKSRAVPGSIKMKSDRKALVYLDESLPDITPGQAAVFYQDQVCLGGGLIQREIR